MESSLSSFLGVRLNKKRGMQFHGSSWQLLSTPDCPCLLWSADNVPKLQSSGAPLLSLALQLWDAMEKLLFVKATGTYLERFSHLLSCFCRESSALGKTNPEQIKPSARGSRGDTFSSFISIYSISRLCISKCISKNFVVSS